MPNERKDGGPAFPQLDVVIGDRDGHGDVLDAYTQATGGMTLRDWFAGQALAGMLAQSHGGPKDWQVMGHGWGEDCMNSLNKHETHIARTMADFSYQMADYMLAAREGGHHD